MISWRIGSWRFSYIPRSGWLFLSTNPHYCKRVNRYDCVLDAIEKSFELTGFGA